MGYLTPVPSDALTPEAVEQLERAAAVQGFASEMRRTLAVRPAILRALNELTWAVMTEGSVQRGLKSLVALVSSVAAGCRHCQAHTALQAGNLDVDPTKIDAVWEFDGSPLFTPAERAALRLARDASAAPNAVTQAHFDDLREQFDDGDIVEILCVICLFGWNNRWNDTAATTTEDPPVAFAAEHLSRWELGKHGRRDQHTN